jgi:hypothetical protein
VPSATAPAAFSAIVHGSRQPPEEAWIRYSSASAATACVEHSLNRKANRVNGSQAKNASVPTRMRPTPCGWGLVDVTVVTTDVSRGHE